MLRRARLLPFAFAIAFGTVAFDAHAQATDAAVDSPQPSTPSTTSSIEEERKALDLEKKTLDLQKERAQVARERSKLERTKTAPEATLIDLIGTLTAWMALMLLLSIGVERVVSLTKRGESLTRKRTLRAFFGDKIYDQIIDPATDARKLARMYDLIGSTDTPPKTAEKELEPGQLYAELVRLDRRLDDGERNRARNLRSLALFIGTILAWLLGIDTLVLLKPVLPTALDGHGFFHALAGFCLSGFAAAAGSAFWNDLLDKLTNWKKKTKEAGAGDA